MEIKEIIKLIEAVSANGLTSFELEENGCRLSMKKKEKETVTVTPPVYQPVSAVPVSAMPVPALSIPNAASVPAEVKGETETSENNAEIASDKVVTSPLVGTFYSAPSPDAEPFVKAGDTVKKGQVLGIVEAMKLMNEIESEFDGVVEAVLVSDEEVVEYGQPLFRIR